MLKFILIIIVTAISGHGFSQLGTGNIRGSIIDAYEKGVAGQFSVSVKLNGKQVATTSSDSEMKFEVQKLEPGIYTVKISALDNSYESLILEEVAVVEDKITFLDNIVLKKKEVPSRNKKKDQKKQPVK